MVPVVSVDDLGDRGAGGVVVDEVLAAGERGDEWAAPNFPDSCFRS
jgi:hypothetical protein